MLQTYTAAFKCLHIPAKMLDFCDVIKLDNMKTISCKHFSNLYCDKRMRGEGGLKTNA